MCSKLVSTISYNLPYIAIEGNCYNTTNCVNNPSSGTWNKDAPVANSPGSGSGKVGVYYNYCAASAGSFCYASGQPSSDPVTTSGYDIGGDICPKGWRMPTGGAVATGTIPGGEYQSLYTAYSSNSTNFQNALSTPLSGSFLSGSARNQGSRGSFWSATYYDSDHMYSLLVYSSDVYPQSSSYRTYGYPVRCVFGT